MAPKVSNYSQFYKKMIWSQLVFFQPQNCYKWYVHVTLFWIHSKTVKQNNVWNLMSDSVYKVCYVLKLKHYKRWISENFSLSCLSFILFRLKMTMMRGSYPQTLVMVETCRIIAGPRRWRKLRSAFTVKQFTACFKTTRSKKSLYFCKRNINRWMKFIATA